MDREPGAWETNAVGACMQVGEVAVYALGQNRFRLVSPAVEREGDGLEPARGLAHELAASL
ncbi:MAG: hypothetical protein E6G34_02390 [Actinobacteria bacterium]|nr:MAG: hypothetical protein E6G34_02390 [Actinomycetota bacterium]